MCVPELPVWLHQPPPQIPPKKLYQLQVSFLLRRAALYHNPQASIAKLADGLGVHHSALYNAMKRGSLTLPLAVSLEMLVGAAIAPKSDTYIPAALSLY
jgi:hypothetical protein